MVGREHNRLTSWRGWDFAIHTRGHRRRPWDLMPWCSFLGIWNLELESCVRRPAIEPEPFPEAASRQNRIVAFRKPRFDSAIDLRIT